MLIRQITQQDLPELRNFAESTFRIAWGAQNDPIAFERYCEQCFSPDQIAREVATPGSYFYFVEWEDRLVAYLKLNEGVVPPDWPYPAAKTIQLERIYVAPDSQNRGIGYSLLEFVSYYAKEGAFDWIWLSVWQEAPKSVRFYEKNSDEICGTEDFWLGGEQQTDWVMRKKV